MRKKEMLAMYNLDESGLDKVVSYAACRWTG